MMTLNELKNHIDKLVEQGKGGREVKTMYDGIIEPIDEPGEIIEEIESDKIGIISGRINKGEFLIKT